MATYDSSSFVQLQTLEHTDRQYLIDISKYTPVVPVIFFLLEILSTLPDEVAYVWSASLTPMKLLFFLNKYSPIVDVALGVTMDLTAHDLHSCVVQFQVLSYCYIIGTLFSELILVARTIALWRSNRYVIFSVVGVAAGLIPIPFVAIHRAIQELGQPLSNDEIRVVGCFLDHRLPTAMWVPYICMIIAETGIVGLTLLRYFSWRRMDLSKSIVVHTMYRDGTLFFMVVLTFSVINLLVMIFAPPELSPCMQMPLRVIHSALCTRVLLNLRKAAARGPLSNTVGFTTQTTVAFDVSLRFQEDGASVDDEPENFRYE